MSQEGTEGGLPHYVYVEDFWSDYDYVKDFQPDYIYVKKQDYA